MEFTYEDEKAAVFLKRGEAFFQDGRYTQTIRQLSACLKCRISEASGWIECKAYNILGDVFLFSGYETSAMENYLSAKQKARDRKSCQQEIYAEIKIGLLYSDMGSLQEALWHFDHAVEMTRQIPDNMDYELLMAAYIQKAYANCKLGQFSEAEKVSTLIDSLKTIHPKIFLPVKYMLIKAQLAKKDGDESKLTACILELLGTIIQEKFKMEHCRYYLDVCLFLLECDRKEEMKKVLEILEPELNKTEFISVVKRFLKVQLLYDKRFSDRKTYQMTCGRYLSQNDSYEDRLLEFRLRNIRNLEELQHIRRERDKYREKSRRDLPTGLLNKSAMEEEIRSYIENRPKDVMDALVIFDIDDFKCVNDAYGHLIGDEVIIKISQILKEIYGNGALLGRFGGDEFVLFIKNIPNAEEMEQKLGKLKDDISIQKFGEHEELSCTISVGVSYNKEVSTSYEALFECADEALYKAKEYGKDKIAFFEIKEGLLKYL